MPLLTTGAGAYAAPAVASPAFLKTDNPAIQSKGFANPATFNTVSIGTASADRIVLVGVHQSFRATSSVTLDSGGGAVSMTQVSTVGATSGITISLWKLSVTSGTTATIVVTGDAGMDLVGITVGILTGCNIAETNVGTHPRDNAADPQQVTATVPSGGVGVAVMSVGGGTTGQTANWGGTATGDYCSDSAGSLYTIMAHSNTAGAQTVGVSGSTSFGFASACMIMACWGA